MDQKISQMGELTNPTGNEEVSVAVNGGNNRLKLSNLIGYIKQMLLPTFTTAVSAITATTAQIDITYTSTNGRSMASVLTKVRYKVSGSGVWSDAPDIAFVNGTLVYNSPLTGLTAATIYNYEVYLADSNEPALTKVVASTFTTPLL